MKKKTPPTQRFWSKVNKTENCWEWIASTFSNGYGQFYDGEHKIGAHRFAYQEEHGEVSKALQVCHKCDNRICVRPSHMFVGTQKDNMEDMIRKNRQPRTSLKGEINGRAIATEQIVLEIRLLHDDGNTIASLARKFCISETQTSRIVKRESWTYL